MNNIIKIATDWYWGTSVFLTTADGHAIIQCVFDDRGKDICELYDLNVHQDYRRQGHATRLMQAAEDEAKARGCKRILLWAEKDTWREDWYRRLGYDDEEFRRPPHESTKWMEKFINQDK